MQFCRQVGSSATTVSEIVGRRDEAVYRAIEEGIQRVNRKAAAQPYHIQKWAILQKDFSVAGGELGRGSLICPHYSGGRAGGHSWPGVWAGRVSLANPQIGSNTTLNSASTVGPFSLKSQWDPRTDTEALLVPGLGPAGSRGGGRRDHRHLL